MPCAAARSRGRAGAGWRRNSPTSTPRARSCATSAPTAPASSRTWSAPAAAAWPCSTPAPRPGAAPRRAPSTATRGSSEEGPGAPVKVATGVAQPPDVHIYIGWIHTASIFIYIMDQGAKGPVPAVPAIPLRPCHQHPREWILLRDTRSPPGGRIPLRGSSWRLDPAVGHPQPLRSPPGPASVPSPGCAGVPGALGWHGCSVCPLHNKPAGLPWGRAAAAQWMGERGEGRCGLSGDRARGRSVPTAHLPPPALFHP